MAFVLGLTGSIGMGKSTTARMFAEEGVPVWDADAAVHTLYAPGGAGAQALGEALPGSLAPDGAVDRAALRRMIAEDPAVLDRLNEIIHPLVAEDRKAFLARHPTGLVLLDIPLLFETGGDAFCDAVAVVTAPAEVQRARVLSRPGVTEADFQAILSRQMPDAEKRARADYLIETLTMDAARARVQRIIAEITKDLPHA